MILSPDMSCCICGLQSSDGFDHQECYDSATFEYRDMGERNDELA